MIPLTLHHTTRGYTPTDIERLVTLTIAVALCSRYACAWMSRHSTDRYAGTQTTEGSRGLRSPLRARSNINVAFTGCMRTLVSRERCCTYHYLWEILLIVAAGCARVLVHVPRSCHRIDDAIKASLGARWRLLYESSSGIYDVSRR